MAVQPGSLARLTTLPVLAELNLDSALQGIRRLRQRDPHLGERFDVDVGGRYSHNKQTASQDAVGVLAGGTPVTSNLRSSDNVFTYSLAPKFKFDEHRAIYARVAKGYRPGGPNVIPPSAPAGTLSSFAPDTVTSYETGFKGESADRRFGLDLSAYHIDWKGIQLLTVVNNFGINANGADAKSNGVEFNATGAADRRPDGVGQRRLYRRQAVRRHQRPGRRQEGRPTALHAQGQPGLQRRLQLVDRRQGSLCRCLAARLMGKQTAAYDADYQAATGEQRQVASYEIVDLRAGIGFGQVELEAYVKNLTDADGKTSTSAVTSSGLPIHPNGAIGTGVIRPRVIGVSLTAGF